MHRFSDIQLQKYSDLENRVRGQSRSLEMSPFDKAASQPRRRSIYRDYYVARVKIINTLWPGLCGEDPLTTVRLPQRSLSSQSLGKY